MTEQGLDLLSGEWRCYLWNSRSWPRFFGFVFLKELRSLEYTVAGIERKQGFQRLVLHLVLHQSKLVVSFMLFFLLEKS